MTGVTSSQDRRQDTRNDQLNHLAARPLDILIIGGGIVGSGIARDAAMRGRGLRVGLVEQNDFASGTSSKSSRLLHGGLRYLAQGRVGLVRQAGREKRILQRIAPHLAQPMPFIFPTYKGTDWPLTKLRIGVKLYDLLCGTHDQGRSGALRSGEALSLVGLNERGLTGGVRYFDSFTNDARLVLDTLRSAQRHGALLGNYMRLEAAKHTGPLWRCQIHDTQADRILDIEARTVVNAAGPWGQQIPNSTLKLRLTKGAHLVISHDRLPITDAVVMAQGNRILFAIPWGLRVILGTTDTDYAGPPELVATDPTDVSYILDQVNRAFPAAKLTPRHVLAQWAGLRPLIADGKAGQPSSISRKHLIRLSRDGWMDVAGGKLTTYRHIAAQAVNKLVRFLDKDVSPSTTATELLIAAAESEGISGLLPPPPSQSLIEHYCRNEWAIHLDDIMLRRTSWHYYMERPEQLATQVGRWMAHALGWDAQGLETELSRYRTASVLSAKV